MKLRLLFWLLFGFLTTCLLLSSIVFGSSLSEKVDNGYLKTEDVFNGSINSETCNNEKITQSFAINRGDANSFHENKNVTFSFASDSGSTDCKSLFDFDNEEITTLIIDTLDAEVSMLEQGGNKKLLVCNRYSQNISGIIIHEQPSNPFNLQGFYSVKADVRNVGDEFIQVEMFVGNDPDGLVRWYCSDYIDLLPGESGTITVYLSWTPWVFKNQPDIVGMRGAPGLLKTDIDKIKSVTFNSRYSYSDNSFTIDNIRAERKLTYKDTAGFFPFVDKFGQFKHQSWTGKINSVSDLKEADFKEKRLLQIHPGSEGLNKYGGYLNGPTLEVRGFFYPTKYKGKWWLVDPLGCLFWSSGINCVSTQQTNTGVEGREHYFSYLPENTFDFNRFYDYSSWASHCFYSSCDSFKTYNFYEANLYRKYGKNWHSEFEKRAVQRLKSWGINTIGFVSDSSLIERKQIPYVGSVLIRNTGKIEGSDGFWGKFHDVFDPGFRKAVRSSVQTQLIGAGDPWCMGVFVDNEMSWGNVGSLALAALKSVADQPAKKAFIKKLKQKYSKIDFLNQRWQTKYRSWNDMLNSRSVPEMKYAQKDLTDFYRDIAETYFRVVGEELEKVAPGQSYLGCRFAWANNKVVIESAARYCDVLSFNKYENQVGELLVLEGLDVPVLIGEFHFGATDRGSLHPGVKAANTQKHRALKYEIYMKNAFDNPKIVGAHWFQYTDQPVTGRGDGENYNVGLVNICDVPYPELTWMFRKMNGQVYDYRLGKNIKNYVAGQY